MGCETCGALLVAPGLLGVDLISGLELGGRILNVHRKKDSQIWGGKDCDKTVEIQTYCALRRSLYIGRSRNEKKKRKLNSPSNPHEIANDLRPPNPNPNPIKSKEEKKQSHHYLPSCFSRP